MKQWLYYLLGALLLATGAVWTFQGLGYLKGSPMTGVTFWATVGPAVSIAGVVLIVLGVQRARRSRK